MQSRHSSRMRFGPLAAVRKVSAPGGGFLSLLLRSVSPCAYLCQEPYPGDEGAVEDVRPSSAGGDVLVSSHSFDFDVKARELGATRKKKRVEAEKRKNTLAQHTALSLNLKSSISIPFSLRKWAVVLCPNKHEAARAAAALAVGLVERRRRACCGSSSRGRSSSGRIDINDDAAGRKRKRACCFCSAPRGDQVRVLAFVNSSRALSLERVLSPFHAHFSQSCRALLRERGKTIATDASSFSTTPSVFFPLVFAFLAASSARPLSPNTALAKVSSRFLSWRRGWKSVSSPLQREWETEKRLRELRWSNARGEKRNVS